MPPKKKPPLFVWDDAKKQFLLDCLNSAKERCSGRAHICKELRKLFCDKYPECLLAEQSVYKYAQLVSKGTPNCDNLLSTGKKASFWQNETDTFLIECVKQAQQQNLLSKGQGLNAGKIGHHGQFRKLLFEHFKAKYPDETEAAIDNRVSILRKEKRIVDDSETVDDTVATTDTITATDTELFQRIIRCWEFGFQFARKPMFLGACNQCSNIIVNELNKKFKIIDNGSGVQYQPIVFRFYNKQDLKLDVHVASNPNSFYKCNRCERFDLLALYILTPITVMCLPLPKAIADLSDDDKRQICLVALTSTTARASSDALRVFKHLKGQLMANQKDQTSYFNMYAMIINRQPISTATTATVSVAAQKVIRIALQWLRLNNDLYKTFSANFETMLRYSTRKQNQPATVPVISSTDFDPANKDLTKSSMLDNEDVALVVPAYNVPARGVNVANTITAVQHVRNFKDAKNDHDNSTKVFIKDKYLEAKVFPWLFPYGIGGWYRMGKYGLTRGAYIQWRIRMCDGRFRNDPDYMFYMLDVAIKERLQYYNSIKVNTSKLSEPLTKQMLDEADKSGNESDQFGTEVPATIPNSRNYWASKTLDLIAISQHMGRVPDLFITLTENDSWPELQAVINGDLKGVYAAPDAKELTSTHKRGTPAMRHPVETVFAFYRRLQEFRKRFLQDTAGPIGNVIDYWIRIEYQKRGSLHAHLVVWVKEGTLPATEVVSAETPHFVNHPMNNKWRELVSSYQRHECYAKRCLRGKRGVLLQRCKYGFPYAVNDAEHLDNNCFRYNYVRRQVEDERIIPYNLALLLFWDGHVNCQKVTNCGWEMYLAKYVAKSEYPIQMRITNKNRTNDCEAYLKGRIVSLLEAATLLLQYPHIFSSREVVYLPIDIHPTFRFLRKGSERANMQETETNVFYQTKLEKYLDRPDELVDLTYPQYYQRYYFREFYMDGNEEIDHDDDDDNDNNNNNNILKDKKGCLIRKRQRREAFVRFKPYTPYGENLEKYCLVKLLKHIAVTEKTLAELKDRPGSYLQECLDRKLIEEVDEAKKFLEGAAKQGFSLTRLREMAARLINGNWLEDQEIDKLLETVATYQMQAEIARAKAVEDDGDNIVIDDRDAMELNVRTYLPVAQYINEFTCDQRAGFQLNTDAWKQDRQILAFVTGGGGVGKSFLLDSLVAYCNANTKTVHKLATTGCAAHLIGGVTIHSFLRMSVDLVSHIERGTNDAYIIDHTEVLVIDEVSIHA